MPIYEMLCRECGHIWEEVLRMGSKAKNCPHCETTKIEKLLSAHGGYQMGGYNGASTRPRRAGSFKKAPK